ncbi:cytochrome P450 monooxygenase pc-3 [Ephemerocybe angulata]|uniref:Cytochrome P450 monooxygenase pc-3 n=1 Tax=Ephemerocybe angulata TaxID=980116 RepID=A0A8H6HMU3_9AGAR|nr:cytochrome P450 monooxygenase pc-3 [Tulosesus angulatus]
MVSLPLGVQYLLRNLPTLIAPPAGVLVLAKLASNHSEGLAEILGQSEALDIPRWLITTLTALSLPVTFAVKVGYKEWKDHRDAAARNAVLPPRVKDRLPGGVGLLISTLKNFADGYPGEQFTNWFKETAPGGAQFINFRVLYEDRFTTTEPDHIKAILATQFDGFEKGPVFHELVKVALGDGVFNSDGEMWKFHRAMTRPFFSKDRISHFDIFDRHAVDALDQLSARLKEGHPVDIQDLASRFTMDSATEFLFAKNVHSLGAGLPYPFYVANSSPEARAYAEEAQKHPANQFANAFDLTQRQLSLRGRKGLHWPLSEFWVDRVKEYMVIINGFIDPILEAALARNQGKEKLRQGEKDREVDDNESLLDHLIHYTDDPKVLRDETLNILLAGRDTTANSITYAIYMLAQNPDVLQRLRQEVLEKVGESRRPTFEDMKDMKYLRAVINETLRLYPAVPFNIRTSNRPVVFPGKNGSPPYYIPAGTKTGYSVFLMHRRKDLWGPDADKFDPDRFLDDRVKTYLTPNPFIFLPFNAGPRICLGQQFAYHETSFFLIRLLQRFTNIKHVRDAQPPASRPPPEWKQEPGTKGTDDIRIKNYLTMSAMGGCWVTMDEA